MAEAPYNRFIADCDVSEEIRVFPDYIQYNTWCGPCWMDYTKYYYMLEGDKLFIKAFDSSLVEFGKNYRETKSFNLIKNGEVNKAVAKQYRKWSVQNGRRIHHELKREYKDDSHFQTPYTLEDEIEDLDLAVLRIEYYKSFTKGHEFRFDGDGRYSLRAKKWIIIKIKKKDWDNV